MTASDKFNAFLVYYHENATKSCGLRVYDHPADSPDNKNSTDPVTTIDSAKRVAVKRERARLRLVNNLSLWRQIGLYEEEWNNVVLMYLV